MRALNLILISALAGLWVYFAVEVAPQDTTPPVAVKADGEKLSAATLNNEGVRLDRQGSRGDALAYLERAHQFRPRDTVIARNVEHQRARVAKRGWARVLAGGTLFVILFVGATTILRFVRWVRDRARLARIRLRGDPWLRIEKREKSAEMPLRFTEPVGPLLRRHPLTIVWSSAKHGKHMKSRPPVRADGRAVTVKLDQDRLERLRRYPGDWKGFLYVGRTAVGETAARVV
ncbi:MAG: hypothetical protein ACYTDU_07280 [Planctomycetota bacterium]|jgi:hypothetical protein